MLIKHQMITELCLSIVRSTLQDIEKKAYHKNIHRSTIDKLLLYMQNIYCTNSKITVQFFSHVYAN